MLGDEHLHVPRWTGLTRADFTGWEPCRYWLNNPHRPAIECRRTPTRPVPEYRTTLCYEHHPDTPGIASPHFQPPETP